MAVRTNFFTKEGDKFNVQISLINGDPAVEIEAGVNSSAVTLFCTWEQLEEIHKATGNYLNIYGRGERGTTNETKFTAVEAQQLQGNKKLDP